MKDKIYKIYVIIKDYVILEEGAYICYPNVKECQNIISFKTIIADALYLWGFPNH